MSKVSDEIRKFVFSRISEIENGQPNVARRKLAELRRGVGRIPGDIPELWGSFLENLPEDLMSYGIDPSRAEWAIYDALTLYALHQQSKDPKEASVNITGQSLGTAMGKLRVSSEDSDRVINRFNVLATASDIYQLSYYLRSNIGLLKQNAIGLDYPSLAVDIFYYQNPDLVSSVRLRWGQDFYRVINKKDDKDVVDKDVVEEK